MEPSPRGRSRGRGEKQAAEGTDGNWQGGRDRARGRGVRQDIPVAAGLPLKNSPAVAARGRGICQDIPAAAGLPLKNSPAVAARGRGISQDSPAAAGRALLRVPLTVQPGQVPLTVQPGQVSLTVQPGQESVVAVASTLASTHIATKDVSGAEAIQSVAKSTPRPPIVQRAILKTKPDALDSKKGSSGHSVEIATNYFKMYGKPNWRLLQYRVDFKPEEDNTAVRKRIVRDLTEGLGKFMFDGSILFTTALLTDNKNTPLVLQTVRNADKCPVEVIFKLVGEVLPTEHHYLQFFNIVLRQCLEKLELQLLGRNYYDPGAARILKEFKLELWPGYVTSISWSRKRESEILTKKIDTRMVELEKDGAEVINNLRKLSSWVKEMLENVRMNVNTLKTKEDPKNTYQEVSLALLNAEDNICMLAASIARWKISEIDRGENDVNNIDESGKYIVTELVPNHHEVVEEEVVKESVGSMSGKINNKTASVKIIKNQLKNGESVTPKTGDEHNLTDMSAVVLVSNLDTEYMDCDRLFNLISLYGPVKRIQFIKSASVEAQFQNALVELGNKVVAKRVMDFLGKAFKIEPSSEINVTDLLLSLPNGSKAFKEFSQKDYFSAYVYYPPSRTLHVSRSPKLNKDEFYKVFDRLGAPVPYKVIWFPNKAGRGLLQFKSEDEALKAICIVNKKKLNGGEIHLEFTNSRKNFYPYFHNKQTNGKK